MNATKPRPENAKGTLGDKLPAPGEPVLVRCPHCRCMAIRDWDGKWRDYFHRDLLPEVLEIIPLP